MYYSQMAWDSAEPDESREVPEDFNEPDENPDSDDRADLAENKWAAVRGL